MHECEITEGEATIRIQPTTEGNESQEHTQRLGTFYNKVQSVNRDLSIFSSTKLY